VGLSGTGIAPTPTTPVATLAPVAIDFGLVTLNTPSAMRAVNLTNTGNAPLNLSALNLIGANAGEFSQTSNCPVGGVLAAGANCTINTRFTPTVAGARAATLTLMSNAAGAAVVDLRGAGAVQAGALAQVAPMQLNFRRVRVGKTSGERDIKVRNTGGSPLLMSSISVTGDFAYETDCGASLPAGKSCEVKVKFKPTVAGSRAGELTVANNAVGAPHVVKLAGVGANRTRDSGERERERERDDDDDDEHECDDEDKCNQATSPFSRRRRD
jgi:hypothetical protein